MARRQYRKGRSKSDDARHVRLFDYMLNSVAWLSLSPAARAVYIEIRRVYVGSNNGRLGLSVRRAAERCRIAKDTATRAFDELSKKGFIECMAKGAFSLKSRHASEWRLTDKKCDVTGRLGDSTPFMKWHLRNQNPVPTDAATVTNGGPTTNGESNKAA
jgi:hypothetical protein